MSDVTNARAALLSSFLHSTHDYAVVFMTPDGVITDWMAAAERVLGYSAEEVIGQNLAIIFTPEDRVRGLDKQELAMARTIGRSEDDRWHLRKNQSRFWASGVLTALKNDAGELVALCKTLRDKTDTRTQIETLQHELGMRNAELERRDAFLAQTVHELRNPLNPIVMALELLRRAESSALAAKAVQVLEKQTELLANLIGDLSAATNTSKGMSLQLQPVNLSEELRATCQGFIEQAAAGGIVMQLVQPKVDITVMADVSRLQQILLNLLGNAVKYTPAGGRIAVSVSIEASMAVVRVEDTGLGISPDALPQIFELFARDGRVAHIDGMGVGLSVVRTLAILQGGSVEARSPGPGLGSAFALRLPACAVPDAEGAEPS